MMKTAFKKNFWQIIFFSAVMLIYFLSPLDTDLGWHLRYGGYFWQTKQFLTTNTFTVLNSNYFWPNSYTFYQIITYALYHLIGFYGLSVAYTILIGFTFFLVYLFLEKNLMLTSFCFLIITLLAWPIFNLGWRSQVFTFFGISLLCYLLKKNFKDNIFYLPLVFLLWTNLHGGFVLGIMFLFCYLLVLLIELVNKKIKLKYFGKLTAITFLSILATFINPYGNLVWWEAWHHLQVPLKGLIAEWVPPPPAYSLLMTLILIISILITSLNKNKGPIIKTLLISIFPFYYLAFTSRRNIPLFLLIAGLLISLNLLTTKHKKNENLINLSKALIILCFIWGLLFHLPKTLRIDNNWSNYCELKNYPCSAIQFIKDKNITENFYNAYEWGGLLEWQLPDSIFFVDGRMPAWPTSSGKSPYTIYLEIIQAQPGWQETLISYKISYLFISKGTFLDLELQQQLKGKSCLWQEIYRDNQAAIYKKLIN